MYHVVPIRGRAMLSPIKEQVLVANKTFSWSEQQSLEDMDNPHSEYYCLMDKERLLGYVGLHHILDEVNLNMVYVEPDFRNRGLASQLLTFTLEQLRHRGVKHLFLEVRKSNANAIKLYERVGFVTLIIRSKYYQNPIEDALIMQLKLGGECE